MQNLPPIALRGMRLQQAVALQEPDRVPFIPTFNNFYQLEYGVSFGDSMRDPFTLNAAVDDVLDRYEPDLMYMPTTFPCQAMDRAGAIYTRYPGQFHNLPDSTAYQYIDHQFLQDEDFDAFLKDPNWYLFSKLLPQKYANFMGLGMLNPMAMGNATIYSLAPLGLPPVQETLKAMLDTGNMVMENLGKCTVMAQHVVERGFIPFGSAVCMCPFDEYADFIRGIMEACIDCNEEPERLQAALEICEQHIPANIANAKMQHAQYLFIPLHCGVDNFMSLENYKKFYWPGLKKVIMAAIEAEMTPVVLCEGKYHTRVLTFDSFFMVAESDGSLYAYNGESRMVSAITQCSIDQPYSVLFTQGHGETVPASLKALFEDVGFTTQVIDLNKASDAELEEAFANARIMVICNPTHDLADYDKDNPNAADETAIINSFLKDYRSLMVFVDASTPDLPNLRSYLSDVWGMDYVPNDLLTDETHSLKLNKKSILAKSAGETGSVAAQLHISFADDSDVKTVFGNAVKLTSGTPSNGASVATSFTTFAEATDKAGVSGTYPLLNIATFMDYDDTNAAKFQYVALCGSTQFVSDECLTAQYGNREVIESAARMMSTERVSPNIDYKVFADTALALETGEAKTLSVIVIAVAPLIVLVIGVGVYIKRRHL